MYTYEYIPISNFVFHTCMHMYYYLIHFSCVFYSLWSQAYQCLHWFNARWILFDTSCLISG